MNAQQHFADWYREASVLPPAELLEARWKGVEAVSAAVTNDQIIPLLALSVERPAADFRAPGFMDEPFRTLDTTFPVKDNLEELRVLAGAILRVVMELDGPLATPSALGIVASTFENRRPSTIASDHIAFAKRYLAQKSAKVRAVAVPQKLTFLTPTKERFDEILPPNHFAPNQTPNLRDPLFNFLAEVFGSLNTTATSLTRSLWHTSQVQREELDLLWWLQAKVSRDLHLPFSEINTACASVVFPTELAILTKFLPGPTAIFGMLVSALESTDQITNSLTVATAINRTGREWREKLRAEFTSDEVIRLCPVLLAVAKSLDTDGEADWLPVFRKKCAINIETDIAPSALGMQLYNELLFYRSIIG